MADLAPAEAEKTETRVEAEAEEAPESAKFWLNELSAAGKRDKTWIDRAKKVVNRFRDERDDSVHRSDKRANILWSNTEILKAALFQKMGSPDVRRRFPKKGRDEKTTRAAALVQERALSFSQDDGEYDCESQIEAAVEDMLLPGRGTAWVVYDARVEGDEVKYQSVHDEHVYWEDFRHSSGRKWSDVWWVGRCHYYSREELREYFPKHADMVPLDAELIDTTQENRSKDGDDTFKRSRVWQIWDKNKKQRIYVAEGFDTILKKDEDPYKLGRFFPCPEPMWGVKTTSTLVPVPEFSLYQDQANELDLIVSRLAIMVEALKRRGVYDAGADGADGQLSQLAHAGDNQFLPYRGMAGLMEKGGLAAAFQSEDLKPIIEVIKGLYEQRAALVQTIYDVTGISDVIRGSSNPNETATAQRIKGQMGSMRLQKRQNMVQRFIRDLARIKAEIISEHFTRETLVEMTGIDMPLEAEKLQAEQALAAMHQAVQMAAQQQQQPPQMGHNGGPPMAIPQPDPEKMKELEASIKAPTWEDVSSILRSDQRRGYKVDVETDQTSQMDDLEEKNSRVEFLNTMVTMFEKLVPALSANPAMVPLLKETIMFTVKAFKAGRPLEESFEDTFDKLQKMAEQNAQNGPPVDPVAQAKAEEIKAKTQATMQAHQSEMEMDKQKMAGQQQIQGMAIAGKQMEIQSQKEELQLKREDAQIDRTIKLEETQMQREENQRNAEVQGWQDYFKLEQTQQQAAFDKQAQETDQKLSLAERMQKMKHAEKKANQPAVH